MNSSGSGEVENYFLNILMSNNSFQALKLKYGFKNLNVKRKNFRIVILFCLQITTLAIEMR